MANALLDFLQGASNSAAANMSAPVDGIAWLLRKAGINVDRPVMGSDWMRERGLTAEPTNKLAGILGESVGGVLPMVTAAKAPQIAQGLLQAERNLAAPRTLNPQTGAVLWDGFDVVDGTVAHPVGQTAIKLKDGTVLTDNSPIHAVQINKLRKQGLPISDIESGGFIRADGSYIAGSADTPRIIEQDRAKQALIRKRLERNGQPLK